MVPSELNSTRKAGHGKAKTKTQIVPRPAKYKNLDEDGSEKTWTGQGKLQELKQRL
ncbi:H-NS family nucleoid-associated regulatory protein [Cronobacter malonaticus]